jgi:hypothetical protein
MLQPQSRQRYIGTIPPNRKEGEDMSKIIIRNDSELDDFSALGAVMKVLLQGKISNGGKQHCYATTMNISGKDKEVTVYTTLNGCSETFYVR